jgi:branched-chain amino acid transport system ATP-binding protein
MAEALVVRNLSKRFGGLRAVQDLSFSVSESETVALIGPNGAGKTTSFNLITGYHRPDAGSVFAFGRELVGLRPHDICSHGLARTFQVARPFGKMTVLANVMTGAFLRDRNIARQSQRGDRLRRACGQGACSGARLDHNRPASAGDGARTGDSAPASAA